MLMLNLKKGEYCGDKQQYVQQQFSKMWNVQFVGLKINNKENKIVELKINK